MPIDEMPVYDRGTPESFARSQLSVVNDFLKDPRAPVVEADPSSLSLLAAHWQAGTSIGALFANRAWRFSPDADTKEMTPQDVQSRLDESGIEPQFRSAFYGVRDTQTFDAVMQDIQGSRDRHRVMAAYGMQGNLAAGLVAGLGDPVNLIPLGGAASKVRMAADGIGSTVAHTAVQGGVAAGISGAVVQFADPTKTSKETVLDIGVGTAFGALLGFGIHAVVGTPKARQIERRLDTIARQSDTQFAADLERSTPKGRSHEPATPEAIKAADLTLSAEKDLAVVTKRIDDRMAEFEAQMARDFPATDPKKFDMEVPAPVDQAAIRPVQALDQTAAVQARINMETPGAIDPSAIGGGVGDGIQNRARSMIRRGVWKQLREAIKNDDKVAVARITNEIAAIAPAKKMGELKARLEKLVNDVKNDLDGPEGSPAPLSSTSVNTYAPSDRADDRLFGVYSPSWLQKNVGKIPVIGPLLRNPRLEMQDALSPTIRSVLDRLDIVPQITTDDIAGVVKNQSNVHGVYRALSGKWAAAQEDAEFLWWRNKSSFKSQDDFGKQVYAAVIQGGRAPDGNKIVEQAAAGYRNYFDAVLKLFRDAKVLKDDVDLSAAESYAPIVHMIDNVRRDSAKFISTHSDAFHQELMGQWFKALDTKRQADAKLAYVEKASRDTTQVKVDKINQEYGNTRQGKVADVRKENSDELARQIANRVDAFEQAQATLNAQRKAEKITSVQYAQRITKERMAREQDIVDFKKDMEAQTAKEVRELQKERDEKISELWQQHADHVEKHREKLPDWDQRLIDRLTTNRDTATDRAKTMAGELAENYYRGAVKESVITGHEAAPQPGLANVLKARKSPLWQQIAADNGWIETNIFRLTETYHRRAGMDAALATVFKKPGDAKKSSLTPEEARNLSPQEYLQKIAEGAMGDVEMVGDPTLSFTKRQIEAEYKSLIDDARRRGNPELEKKLLDERDRQVKNLETILNLTRGKMSDAANIGSDLKAAADMGLMFNAWRLMGGTVVSSLADPLNLTIANGFSNAFRYGILPVFSHFKAAMGKVPRDELPDVMRINRLMGIVVEHQQNSRLGAMVDIAAEAPSNRIQAWMQRLNKTFWDVTGITYWTNFWKNAAANVTHARIITAAQEGFEAQSAATQAWLTNLKITRGDLKRIAAQYDTQPEKFSMGVPYAALDKWSDQTTATLVANAIDRESHNVIVTPTAGDKLALQATPVGQLVWQFRTFGVAFSSRVMARNAALANVDSGFRANLYLGLASLGMAGVLVDGLKTTLSDVTITGESKDGYDGALTKWMDRWQKTPGEAMYNALDRTGAFWLLTEPSNVAQKLGLPNIQGAMSIALQDEADKRSGSSRFAQRSVADVALGPSVSLIEDFAKLGHFATGAAAYGVGLNPEFTATRGDMSRIRRMVPLNNALVMQQIMNYGHQQIGTIFDMPLPRH